MEVDATATVSSPMHAVADIPQQKMNNPVDPGAAERRTRPFSAVFTNGQIWTAPKLCSAARSIATVIAQPRNRARCRLEAV
jgi:hypothetical protein